MFTQLRYIIYLSWQALKERKLRSVLTIGGISIGIGTIVFLVSLGFGLQRLIVNQVTDVQSLTILDVSTGASTLIRIQDETLETFESIDKVIEVSPSLNVTGQAVKGDTATDIAIYGIDPELIVIEGVQVSWGKNLSSDTTGIEVVLSNTAARLLGFEDPNTIIGESIDYDVIVPPGRDAEMEAEETLQTINTTIRGVTDEAIAVAYLPISSLQNIGFYDYNLARVKVNDREDLRETRSIIEGMGFQVDSVADTVGQIDQIFVVFEIIMAAFGLIAMAVASLGAFNTLTVSLLERTHEVGLMMALGTKRRFIYRLFLIESFIIGVMGGTIGMVAGVVFGETLNFITNKLAARLGGTAVDVFYAPWYFVLIVIGLILAVGFFTGLYPARRASRINPLDAMRYE